MLYTFILPNGFKQTHKYVSFYIQIHVTSLLSLFVHAVNKKPFMTRKTNPGNISRNIYSYHEAINIAKKSI